MQSPELDPLIYKLNFKMALDAAHVRPMMKKCKGCGVLFSVIGKMIGARIECPECHKQYILRQEVVLKTIIDPVEVV
jgi:predicted RNA-binding Zn-ribbon protein involved in translation (DUF1610 family)